MSEKRNVSVCRGHELANTLYSTQDAHQLDNSQVNIVRMEVSPLWRRPDNIHGFVQDGKSY